MSRTNIEAGVRRALTAYKAEVGADEATAAAWADQNLSEGVELFTESLREGSGGSLREGSGGSLNQKRHSNDYGAPAEEAFEKLKAWATTKL